MTRHSRDSPLHYALTYHPFNLSDDPEWGIVAFWRCASDYLHRLSLDYPSFDRNATRLCIESEYPEMTFGLIEISLEEFIFSLVDRELFDILVLKLNLTIYHKDGNCGTSKFSANALLAVVEGLVRRALIDEVLANID